MACRRRSRRCVLKGARPKGRRARAELSHPTRQRSCRPRDALYSEFLPAALHGPGLSRKADHDTARVVAHQPRLQRRICLGIPAVVTPIPIRRRNMTRKWDNWPTARLAQGPPESLYMFLHHNFDGPAVAWHTLRRSRRAAEIVSGLTGFCCTLR